MLPPPFQLLGHFWAQLPLLSRNAFSEGSGSPLPPNSATRPAQPEPFQAGDAAFRHRGGEPGSRGSAPPGLRAAPHMDKGLGAAQGRPATPLPPPSPPPQTLAARCDCGHSLLPSGRTEIARPAGKAAGRRGDPGWGVACVSRPPLRLPSGGRPGPGGAERGPATSRRDLGRSLPRGGRTGRGGEARRGRGELKTFFPSARKKRSEASRKAGPLSTEGAFLSGWRWLL